MITVGVDWDEVGRFAGGEHIFEEKVSERKPGMACPGACLVVRKIQK